MTPIILTVLCRFLSLLVIVTLLSNTLCRRKKKRAVVEGGLLAGHGQVGETQPLSSLFVFGNYCVRMHSAVIRIGHTLYIKPFAQLTECGVQGANVFDRGMHA